MKHSNFSRILSFVLALVMVLSMAPARVFASDSATYTRVTADQADWSGEYLLVYEAGSLAFDGSLSTVDAVNNYQAVTIDGAKFGLYASQEAAEAATEAQPGTPIGGVKQTRIMSSPITSTSHHGTRRS